MVEFYRLGPGPSKTEGLGIMLRPPVLNSGECTIFGLAVIAFLLSTLLMFWLREQRPSAAPSGALPYGALLTNRRFMGFLLLTFGAAMAFQIGYPLVPNYLAQVRRLDAGAIGLLGSFETLGMTALNIIVGPRSPRRAYMLGQALMARFAPGPRPPSQP